MTNEDKLSQTPIDSQSYRQLARPGRTSRRPDKLSQTIISYIETVTQTPIDDLDMYQVNDFINDLNDWIDSQTIQDKD